MKTTEPTQTRMSHNEAMVASYPIQVSPLAEEEGGGFQALFPPLARGIVGYGPTPEAAIADLHTTIPLFLKRMDKTEQILPVTVPEKDWDDFSGKFNVRVAKMLHAQLVELAEDQGVSLNSLVQTMLASGATALAAGKAFGITERNNTIHETPYFWHEFAPAVTSFQLDRHLTQERITGEWSLTQEN